MDGQVGFACLLICTWTAFIYTVAFAYKLRKASTMRPSNAFAASKIRTFESFLLFSLFIVMANVNVVAANAPMKVTVVGGTHGNE
jgi:hypothetical protein